MPSFTNTEINEIRKELQKVRYERRQIQCDRSLEAERHRLEVERIRAQMEKMCRGQRNSNSYKMALVSTDLAGQNSKHRDASNYAPASIKRMESQLLHASHMAEVYTNMIKLIEKQTQEVSNYMLCEISVMEEEKASLAMVAVADQERWEEEEVKLFQKIQVQRIVIRKLRSMQRIPALDTRSLHAKNASQNTSIREIHDDPGGRVDRESRKSGGIKTLMTYPPRKRVDKTDVESMKLGTPENGDVLPEKRAADRRACTSEETPETEHVRSPSSSTSSMENVHRPHSAPASACLNTEMLLATG